MKKEEVELVVLGVSLGNEEALKMKVYKDGTLCRIGSGGIPNNGVSGITYEGSFDYFARLMEKIDERLLEKPRNLETKGINSTPLVYYVVFYGESQNGETGEQAKWNKSTGVKVAIDPQQTERPDLVRYLDSLLMFIAEITNEWYFDIVMSGAFSLNPVGLPNTLIGTPNNEEKQKKILDTYLQNILAQKRRGWDIVAIGHDREFKNSQGRVLSSVVKAEENDVSISFREEIGLNDPDPFLEEMEQKHNAVVEENSTKVTPASSKKKWWEFWK